MSVKTYLKQLRDRLPDSVTNGSGVSAIVPKLAKQKRPSFVAPPDDGKIRLNLGSGDKNLPGYINVDFAASRKGVSPDIIGDLRSLDLPENYADEIMAIHVIEHFYLWEAGPLLTGWKRILKPGGKIVLECPNLLSAAKELVANPTLAFSKGKDMATTMWPFFGDPSWEDPLMCHRWGYTPESLMETLREVGFVDLKEEVPLFKKGAPRDLRVSGIKP